MPDQARIEHILNQIRKIWYQNPDLRLCQLLFNAAHCHHPAPEFFYTEDETLQRNLELIINGQWTFDDI